ncbi:hypothetical protein [Pseudomonas sp. P1.31]|uniref:hypothetical protein n=1 Tax=Pseudomonas sp. P1.31 TaxID=1699311 RepID=UPI00069E8C6A|nr:hypothetical protein [Pseudomonas sp. P1.31]
MSEEFDISQTMAAELTDTVGMPDVIDSGDELPEGLDAAVAEFDLHAAEKDLALPTDLDDTRQGALDRESEQDAIRQGKRKVPIAALHEERSKRQALELQLQVQAQQFQQLQTQWQATQQAQQQAAEQAAIPDFDEDPRGYIEAKERQFAQALNELQNGPAQQQQQIQTAHAQLQREVDAMAPVLVEVESSFMAKHPDYTEAFNHVQQDVEAKLRQMHPQADPAQFGLLRSAALVAFTKQCQANGVNPCEHIYQRAQQMGFKAASRAPRREPPTSLSNAHGSARAPDEKSGVSASEISSMSEAEFDKFWAGMKRGSAIGPAF